MTVDELFQRDANGFRPAGDRARRHELVDRSGQFVVDPRHQLWHALSIAECNAPTVESAGSAPDRRQGSPVEEELRMDIAGRLAVVTGGGSGMGRRGTQLHRRRSRRLGPDVRDLLGWGVQLQSRVRSAHRRERRGVHREHEQRERVLGGARPAEDVDDLVRQVADGFRANAPVSASEAATVRLDGVRNDAWRILVGGGVVDRGLGPRLPGVVTYVYWTRTCLAYSSGSISTSSSTWKNSDDVIM